MDEEVVETEWVNEDFIHYTERCLGEVKFVNNNLYQKWEKMRWFNGRGQSSETIWKVVPIETIEKEVS